MKSHPADKLEKRCPDCGVAKPLVEFWRNRATADGYYAYCKACGRVRNAAATLARRAAAGLSPARPRPSTEALPEGMKRCPDCRAVLPATAFVRNKSHRDGVGSYCRPCQNIRVSASRQRLHCGSRHYHLKRRYGIGAADVLKMVRDQLWRCPICTCQLTLRTAHVDHDHKTSKVRAITCFNCNGGLGQFKDDPISLRRAAEYVEGNVWQPTKLAPGRYQMPISPPAARPSPSSSARTPPIFSPGGVRRLRPH